MWNRVDAFLIQKTLPKRPDWDSVRVYGDSKRQVAQQVRQARDRAAGL